MVVITQVDKARLLVLRAALSLELKGMTRRGRSAYAIVKDEFGFKGNRKSVARQLDAHIESITCPKCKKWMPDNKSQRALSRRDNETYICPECGTEEALQDAGII